MNTPTFGAGCTDPGNPPTNRYPPILGYDKNIPVVGRYKVTFVSNISYSDGISTYRVYQGVLNVRRNRSESHINLNARTTKDVALYRVDKRKGEQAKHLTWALNHATEEYPAFNWGRGDDYYE